MNKMRIAVIGNCQAVHTSRAMNALSTEIAPRAFSHAELRLHFNSGPEFIGELKNFDVVMSQPFAAGHLDNIDSNVLRNEIPNLIMFPVIEFTAFHPDCIYVIRECTDGSRPAIQSALGDYSSALTVLGYRAGLSVDETQRLFSEPVYRLLGYTDFWPQSEEALLRGGRELNFPLDKLYRRWLRRGCFMLSINHPRMFATGDIALELLRRAGAPAEYAPVEEYLIDEAMLGPIWPVYPEIGSSLSVPGSYLFKGWSINIPDGQSPFMRLKEFIARSYRLYAEQLQDPWLCGRVDEWLTYPDVINRAFSSVGLLPVVQEVVRSG